MDSELAKIPLGKIRANPVALRGVDRTGEGFIQLVDSIKQYGVNNPIVVRRKPQEDGKEFELIDGLQRFSASLEAGKEEIPAHIKSESDGNVLILQIIGNAHKIETKPVEYARALMRILASNPTWTEAQLAQTLNKSPTWINKQLGLVKLHDQIKPLVDGGQINVTKAVLLSKLPQDEQMNWLERAQTEETEKFTEAVTARSKEIRAANRQGKDAAPESFTPVAHLRKKNELEEAATNPTVAQGLVAANNLTEGLKANAGGMAEAAIRGIQLGLKWALNLDSKSVEDQKAKYEARKKQDADAKVRRDAEREQKKAEEAQKRAEEARKAAAGLQTQTVPV